MTSNPLLEQLLLLSVQERYGVSYYSKEPEEAVKRDLIAEGRKTDIFCILGIENIMDSAARSEGWGAKEYGELVASVYCKQLELSIGLKRDRSTEPRMVQNRNWMWYQHFDPDVLIGFDLDLEKNYLEISITTTLAGTYNQRIVGETHSFMERLRIPRGETPARFGL